MSLDDLAFEIVRTLSRHKFSAQNEKMLQIDLGATLRSYAPIREHRLDDHNIIDFFVDGIGIEVKIKGGRKEIFRQCQRYCDFEEIKAFVLVTNRATGFPKEINGKPCYVVNLGMGWL